MICVPVHKKTVELIFKILISKFLTNFWNSLNGIPAVTFDCRFFTHGELMLLGGFIKQQRYLGRQAAN